MICHRYIQNIFPYVQIKHIVLVCVLPKTRGKVSLSAVFHRSHIQCMVPKSHIPFLDRSFHSAFNSDSYSGYDYGSWSWTDAVSF